ncbi:MAG: tetratricopeptide repeat protein [Gemmatimonadota bacterium]|nr:MAG: tetratricopeptide repeat protein [Gemmatimonadota bacterium]
MNHFSHVLFSLLSIVLLFQSPRVNGVEDEEVKGVSGKKLVEETWMSTFVNDVQVGYSHMKTYTIKYHGHDALQFVSDRLMRAKIRGHKYETSGSTTLIVSPKYEPLYFKVVRGSGRHEMSAEGSRDEDMMIAEKHSPWTSSQVNIPLEPNVFFPGHELKAMEDTEIELGVKYIFKIIDIEDLQVKEWPMMLLERRPFEPDSILIFPEAEGPLHVEKWSVGDNIIQYWKDGTGATWRREEGNQFSLRTTQEKAIDFAPELDIWENIAFKSDKVILNSKKTSEMKIQFKVKGIACGNIFGEDERLRVVETTEKEDTCIVVVHSTVPALSESAAVDLPVDESDFEAYLGATPYIQSDDTTIVNLAQEIVGEERNAYKVAVKLCEWVHFNIDYRFLFSNVTARDVLKTKSGDCSEFSLLYTAMARAAGVPTRECQGIVYGSDGKFYRHAWIESWVGEWVTMDPTWNELIADATHLKFGEMYESTPKSITPVDIRVLDYAFETERHTVRMSDIDLNLGFDYNDSLSKKYSSLKKKLIELKKSTGSGTTSIERFNAYRQELSDFISRYSMSISAVNARHDIAETYFFTEDYDKAIAELEAFIDAYYYLNEELTGSSLHRIGECYLRMKRYDEALSTFREVKERYPQSRAVDNMVIDVEEIAHYLWDRSRYPEAIEQYEEMMNLFPSRKTVYQEKLADIYYSQGEYDKALNQYDDMIALYPDRKTIYNEQIALLYRRLGRIEDAVSKFEEMIELFPEREMIYREQIADTYNKAKRFDEAVVTYEELARLFPERETIYFGQIAKIFQNQGNYQRAITQYEQLAKLHPVKTKICYEQIAKLYLGQQMYAEAIAQYEYLIELFPERKMIYQERIASVYEKEQAYDKAISQYQELIRNYPEREKIYTDKIEKLSHQEP